METTDTLTTIKYVPGWTENQFDLLWTEIPWERRDDAPRYECWMNDFNMPYTYGRGAGTRTYEAQPWHPLIKAIQGRLLEETGFLMEGCFSNGYKDAWDHLGWHADDSPEIRADVPIAVVSFGAEREIWFRPKGSKGERTHAILLGAGSLLLMLPGMQQEWEHRIPKSSTDVGVRLSLTYRGLIRSES